MMFWSGSNSFAASSALSFPSGISTGTAVVSPYFWQMAVKGRLNIGFSFITNSLCCREVVNLSLAAQVTCRTNDLDDLGSDEGVHGLDVRQLLGLA